MQREASGRTKRVSKWFASREAADAYQREKTQEILTIGTAGIKFDAVLKTDALAAKQVLEAAGHRAVTLLQLARDFAAKGTTPGAAKEELAPLVVDFLNDKEHVDGAQPATVGNLKNRLWSWIGREKTLLTVADLTRERIDALRSRPGVGANSRRNDYAAASSFCTWLFEKGRLAHHPMKGLRRPRVPHGPKAIFTTGECERLLTTAQTYKGGKWLGTVVVMLYVGGARPSEVADTRLFYGRSPSARIEGGKLRGRANRTVPLCAAARAWLKVAGDPATVRPMHARARQEIMAAAGLPSTADVLRHTCISNRQQIVQNDGAVARESGTSETIIYRHYHRLVTPAEAKAWAALRPEKGLTNGTARPNIPE